MAHSLPVSTSISYLLNEVRNTIIKSVSLAASASAAAVMEVFDGAIDAADTVLIVEGGSGYSVGDLLTLAAGELGGSGSRAVVRVTQIDDLSPSSSVSSSPSLSVSSSVSSSTSPSSSASPSTSISTSPSTSVSSSPSPSVSPSSSESVSTSISSSPSPSESTSTSISSSPSTSISSSVSTSPSSSISSSPSTSISSSASASLSPSVGAGMVTAIELITAGGGYTANNTYATTTDGDGTGATIKVTAVTDPGTSVAKLAALTSTFAGNPVPDEGIVTTKGISVRISGTSAKGHVAYA